MNEGIICNWKEIKLDSDSGKVKESIKEYKSIDNLIHDTAKKRGIGNEKNFEKLDEQDPSIDLLGHFVLGGNEKKGYFVNEKKNRAVGFHCMRLEED